MISKQKINNKVNNNSSAIKVKILDDHILLTTNDLKNQNNNKDYCIEKSDKGIKLCLNQIKEYLDEKIK